MKILNVKDRFDARNLAGLLLSYPEVQSSASWPPKVNVARWYLKRLRHDVHPSYKEDNNYWMWKAGVVLDVLATYRPSTA